MTRRRQIAPLTAGRRLNQKNSVVDGILVLARKGEDRDGIFELAAGLLVPAGIRADGIRVCSEIIQQGLASEARGLAAAGQRFVHGTMIDAECRMITPLHAELDVPRSVFECIADDP